MRKAITAMASLAVLGLATPAFAAEGVSYSFLELGYVNTEIDDIDADGDGFGLRGSYALTKNVHGFAEYADQDFDFDIGLKQYEVGVGVNWPAAAKLDVIGTVGYVKADFDTPIGDTDDDGFSLGAALRGKVTEMLELRGGVNYVEFDEAGNDTAFEIGARFYVTPMFALGADADFDDDGTTWTLGARFDFGK